ncbi:MAG: hypothetical protein IJK18_09235 [Clostridia bacterium]|nr:hypothetical protein [Clostridia bacterium]
MKKIFYGFITMVMFVLLSTTIVKASSTKINAPQNVKASISGTSNVKVKWSKVEEAKKYKIYRATSAKGKYKKVGISKTTSFINKDLSRGKTYFYKVVAIGKDSKSKKSSYAKIKVLSQKQVLKKIRNALKDKKWVKNNIKMKQSVFGTKIIGGQTLYFGKLKNKELVAIEAVSEENYSVQMFLVGYKNGKVVATSSTEGPMHYFHGGPYIDLNSGVAGIGSLHMGYEYNKYFKVSSVKFKELDEFQNNAGAMSDDTFYQINGKKVSQKKYNSTLKKYSKYNFTSLQIKGGHKLNGKNVDKYVK